MKIKPDFSPIKCLYKMGVAGRIKGTIAKLIRSEGEGIIKTQIMKRKSYEFKITISRTKLKNWPNKGYMHISLTQFCLRIIVLIHFQWINLKWVD